MLVDLLLLEPGLVNKMCLVLQNLLHLLVLLLMQEILEGNLGLLLVGVGEVLGEEFVVLLESGGETAGSLL